ncbi:Ribosome biogenesis protein NOP53 [Entamoeba marina]
MSNNPLAFSDRLSEKKFMSRGKEEEPRNVSRFGVSYTTILHELEKSFNLRKSFKPKQKVIDLTQDEQPHSNMKNHKEKAPKKSSIDIKPKRHFLKKSFDRKSTEKSLLKSF